MEKSENSKGDKVDRLLTYLAKKIDEHRPSNAVYFIVDILCTYYQAHVPNLSKIWLMDKELDNQRQLVRDFFRHNNSTSSIAQHFINAGFDSLDALSFLSTDVLDDIQAYNGTTWLPGHKIRVHQIFSDIANLTKEYKDLTRSQQLMKTLPAGVLNKKLEHPQKIADSVYYYPTPLGGTKEYLHQRTLFNDEVNLQKIANLSAEITANKAIDVLYQTTSAAESTTPQRSGASCC